MPIVPTSIGPLVFGPSRRKPLKRPKVVVDTHLVEKNMLALIPEVQAQFAIALNNLADKVVEKVQEGTPVMDGDLKSTVRRDKVKRTKTTVLVAVRAGGKRGTSPKKKFVNYAAVVHQVGSPLGRGRFFVINPVMQMAEAYLPKMSRKAVERAVRKVGRP